MTVGDVCSCCAAFVRAAWPHIVPPLIAVALEAPFSLKVWLAVQDSSRSAIDFTARGDAGGKDVSNQIENAFRRVEKLALTHIAPAYLLGAALIGAYLQTASFTNADTTALFYTLTLGPLFVFATWRFFAIFSGIYALGVCRDAEGDPRLTFSRRATLHPGWEALPAFGALSVAYGSIALGDTLCTTVVHIALLQTLVSADLSTTKSFRAMVLYALTNVATLLFLAFVLFVPASPLYMPITSLPSLLSSFDLSPSPSRPDLETRYPLLALAILWNIFPTELAALCLRADFAQYISLRSLEPLPQYQEEEDRFEDKIGPIYLPGADKLSLPPTYTDAETLSSRFNVVETHTPVPVTSLIPQRLPSFTPRPLFATAIVTQLGVTLALLVAIWVGSSSGSGSSVINTTGPIIIAHVGPLAPLVGVPVAVLGTLVCAALTRVSGSHTGLRVGGGNSGWRGLWKYTEVWGAAEEAGNTRTEA